MFFKQKINLFIFKNAPPHNTVLSGIEYLRGGWIPGYLGRAAAWIPGYLGREAAWIPAFLEEKTH